MLRNNNRCKTNAVVQNNFYIIFVCDGQHNFIQNYTCVRIILYLLGARNAVSSQIIYDFVSQNEPGQALMVIINCNCLCFDFFKNFRFYRLPVQNDILVHVHIVHVHIVRFINRKDHNAVRNSFIRQRKS